MAATPTGQTGLWSESPPSWITQPRDSGDEVAEECGLGAFPVENTRLLHQVAEKKRQLTERHQEEEQQKENLQQLQDKLTGVKNKLQCTENKNGELSILCSTLEQQLQKSEQRVQELEQQLHDAKASGFESRSRSVPGEFYKTSEAESDESYSEGKSKQ